jgi:hypothetical protein
MQYLNDCLKSGWNPDQPMEHTVYISNPISDSARAVKKPWWQICERSSNLLLERTSTGWPRPTALLLSVPRGQPVAAAQLKRSASLFPTRRPRSTITPCK